MPQIHFDATKVDPSVPFEVLPAGKYVVEITKSEVKPTKSGTGAFLELEYSVIEGELRGRKVWDRLCLEHPTPKTVEIARANLSAICHAVGVMQLRDSSQLHHIPLVITVKLKKDEEKDEFFNEIKGHEKRESQVPAVTPQSYQPEVYQQADESAAPWQREQASF